MEETTGTATATTEAPTSTAQVEGQAQPAQPKVESTPTPAIPTAPVSPNWDDEANPHLQEAKRLKAQHDGLQGNFKQLKQQYDQTQREMVEMRTERERETARRVQAEQDVALEKLLDQGDPADPVVANLKKQLEQRKAQAALETTILPRVRQEVHQQAFTAGQQAMHEAYQRVILSLAEQWGLKQDELPNIIRQAGEAHGQAKASGRLDGYDPGPLPFVLDLVRQRGQQQALEVERRKWEQEKQSALTAQETTILARVRGEQKSPDTSTAQPGGDERAWLSDYATGGSNDHKRAKQWLDKLTSGPG